MSSALSSATRQKDDDESVLEGSNPACERCKTHKVACSRERPKCSNCQRARSPCECVYPFRDRKVLVLQSVLRDLKRKRPSSLAATSSDSPDACLPASNGSTGGNTGAESNIGEGLSFENTGTFIQPHYIGEATLSGFLHQFITTDKIPSPPRQQNYYKIERLPRLTSADCELPKRNDAQLLVEAVLRFIGPDYHLIMRKSFFKRLDETYKSDETDGLSLDKDPIWRCRLFAVFALGELYSERVSETRSERGVPPGTAYFEKAMALFQDLYEEPTIPYIETLLVIAFYSTALNRIDAAYRIPDELVTSPRDREHRIRVWWTVYNLDRVFTSKVGLPIMLRDEDIDAPLPSMENLSNNDKEDFHDPSYIIAQIKLAKITGEIFNDIYRIPRPHQANPSEQSVNRILKSLYSWRDGLPSNLQFNRQLRPMYSSRSVASLHLNFGNCIILTTKHIFARLLRSYLHGSKNEDSSRKRPPSRLEDTLSYACVDAARKSSTILKELWVNKDMAIFGFFDALSIFSSTIILMMSSAMHCKAQDGDADIIDTSVNKLLKDMRDAGNMAAHDYYEQLNQLKSDLDHAREQMSGDLSGLQCGGDQSNGLQLPLAANDTFSHVGSSAPGTTAAPMSEGTYFEDQASFDMGSAFDDPFMQGWLNPFAQQQPFELFMEEANSFPPSGDLNGQWIPQWANASLAGTVQHGPVLPFGSYP